MSATYARTCACGNRITAQEVAEQIESYNLSERFYCTDCLRDTTLRTYLEQNTPEEKARLEKLRQEKINSVLAKATKKGIVPKPASKKMKAKKFIKEKRQNARPDVQEDDRRNRVLKFKQQSFEPSVEDNDLLVKLFSQEIIRQAIKYFLDEKEYRIKRVFSPFDEVGLVRLDMRFMQQNFPELLSKPSDVVFLPLVAYWIIQHLDRSDAMAVYGRESYQNFCEEFGIKS
jgi:hypothetical protein